MSSAFLRKILISTLALALLASSATLAPRRAEAFIGAALTGGGIAPAGVATMALGGALIAAGFGGAMIRDFTRSPDESRSQDPLFVGGFFTAVIGALILNAGDAGDASQPGQVRFAPVDEAGAARLGMSTAERDAYDGELDEINAVYQSIAAELARTPGATIEQSRELWSSYAAGLSPEAFSGMARVIHAAAMTRP